MKRRTVLLALRIAVLSFLSPGVLPAGAELEVSASVQIHSGADFDGPLASCGTWVAVGSYGRCWRPAGIAVGWRPYCDGYWIWTDCGWYWVSDEPWAWACYHYGYWVYDSIYGWIWVPGVEWAPAWVCWRFGGGYVGWAPLPPHRFVASGHPADSAFVFVDNDHFGRPLTSASVIVNNPAINRRTTFVSNTERVTRNLNGAGPRTVIINEGPGLAVMEKNTGRKFTAISIIDADRRTPAPAGFRHSAVPTEINHEQKSLATPDHHPSDPNRKENGNIVPSGKQRPDHNKVPSRSPDASPGSNRDQGGGHGPGHDHD